MIETAEERRAREHREDLQRLRGFRPIDDDFMRGLFKDNIPLVQLVLRIIIGKKDLIITKCETQADMKRVTGARSLCLDAYGTDSTGKKYDIEIQRSDKGAEPHRARYHSSVMDVENLDAGQDFHELPDTYTIFITEKDFYGQGEPLYLIQNMNVTTLEAFGDGAYIIYVNGEYRGDDELGRLMHDFNCHDAEDMHYEVLADRTRYLKDNPKGVTDMCKVMEDMRDEALARGREEGLAVGREEGLAVGREEGLAVGREEGLAVGKAEGSLETLFSLVQDGILPLAKAAERMGLTESQFSQRLREAGLSL